MAFRMKSKLEYRHVSTWGGSTSKSHDNDVSKKVNQASTSGTSNIEGKGNIIVDSKKATEESGRNVEDVYNEIAQYMASGGANDASFLEDEDYDIHDSCTYRDQVK
uniref:Uncharacterized protein n=1 Tax=Tanacetum cinerariifolium TaxID=118510 RepID=A0A699HJ86_TANCI|nr:hypothetical protein [Tanacetum cinerariifolium]